MTAKPMDCLYCGRPIVYGGDPAGLDPDTEDPAYHQACADHIDGFEARQAESRRLMRRPYTPRPTWQPDNRVRSTDDHEQELI